MTAAHEHKFVKISNQKTLVISLCMCCITEYDAFTEDCERGHSFVNLLRLSASKMVTHTHTHTQGDAENAGLENTGP